MSMKRRVARFNRMVGNRLLGPLLTRLPGFGTIHHRGRRSGRAYATPVRLFRRGDDYVITLPYGRNSDWVRNVLAAGTCELVTAGRRIRVIRPTLFTDDGRVAVPAFVRKVLSRINSTEFLALTPVESVPVVRK